VQSCLWVPNLVMNVVAVLSSLYAEEGDSRLPPDDLVAKIQEDGRPCFVFSKAGAELNVTD